MTPGDRVPEQLLAAAARAAAPQLGPAARRDRFGPRRRWVTASGQIWRAADGDTASLVLIVGVGVGVGADAVTVAPVTIGEPAEDETSLVVSPERTAFGVDATIWARMQQAIPTMVLDCPVDEVGNDIVTWVAERGPLPTGCRLGQPLPSVFAVDADFRAEIEDDILRLAETPSWAARPETTPAAARLKAQQVRDHLGELTARLDLPTPAVLDLFDGKRPPTPGQAEVLLEVLGTLPSLAAPDPALVQELNQPRWRGLVRRWAQRLGVD